MSSSPVEKKFFYFTHLKKSQRLSIILGNLLEHFDSSLYGFLAPLLGEAFFPSFSPLYQLILTYSIYAVTFIARPLGGIFFSKLTYHYGPLRTLSWSLLGVAITTGMMGLIPGAQVIGILAPCLLVITRLLQSFCAAGENAIAGYYLLERTSTNQQVSWSGIYQSSTVLGILMGSSLSALILASPFSADLWRLAFIFGFVLGIFGLWMRFQLQSDISFSAGSFKPVYEKIWPRLKQNKKMILCLVPVYGFTYLTYSIPFVFLNPYLSKVTPVSLPLLMQQTTILLWIDALFLPVIALLAQRWPWKRVLCICVLVFTVTAFILLHSLDHASFSSIFIGRFIMVMAGIGFASALMPWTAALYPPKDKYLLHSVGYALGSELFGRSAPALCLWLYAVTENSIAPLFYIGPLALVTLLMLYILRFK
jgi:MFS family permease